MLPDNGSYEVLDAAELAKRWHVPVSWIRNKRENGPPIHSLAFASGAMCVSSGTAPGLLHGGRNDGRNESSRVCKFCAVG